MNYVEKKFPIKTSLSWLQSVSNNSVIKMIIQNRAVTSLVALAVVSVAIGLSSPYFFTMSNWANILRQTSVLAIAATGMTFVIVTSGIDLSIGSVLAFASVILGSIMLGLGSSTIAIALCLLSGIALGLLNGVLISLFRLPPFIVTLGMMSVARGGAMVYSGGMSYSITQNAFRQISDGSILGIPTPGILIIVIAVMAHIILTKTKLGYYVFAVGGNEEASRLSGINVQNIKLFVYGLSGLTAAIGAVVTAAQLGSAQPISGNLLELDAIAACVIGGTSLSGGTGRILGAVIGAFIMTIIENGLNLLNVNPFWEQVVIGCAVIIAVSIDRFVNQKQNN